MLALGVLVALPAVAPAQDPQPSAPEGQQQQNDEDDEELGEEIPDDEGEEEGQETETPGGGTNGGGDPTPPAQQRATPAEPQRAQLPRTGDDPVPLLIAGMLILGCGLVLWSAVPPPAIRRR